MNSDAPATAPADPSPFAPFRRRAFLWIWLGMVVATIGLWGQTVGAQWLFVHDPNASTIVPLVQTANALPVMLLALPAGVLADAFDRRWLMIGVQAYSVVVATLLTVLTALGMMPPALLLAFTFAVGAGIAMLAPAWQSLITELVPRQSIVAATRLDMVSVNVSRAAGPAVAGVVIAHWGVPPVFAINAVAAAVLGAVLLAWRRPRAAVGERERFLPALRAGGRYVRHEPVVRRMLLRFACFMLPACSVWALLPLVANHQLGLGADGYGLLFASLGIGAVAAALGLGLVRRRLSSNGVLVLAGVSYAVALGVLALSTEVWLAVPMLMVCGFGWSAAISTVMSELQLFLPGWVRGRALAVLLMVMLGSQAVASPLWGLLTGQAGLRTALLTAAALTAAGAVAGIALRVPESEGLDRTPRTHWNTPALGAAPEPAAGPVLISVEYDVADDQEQQFLAAMQAVRRSRLRSGATRWELYRVGEAPEVFLEQFLVPSWREHERQHEGRLTAEDQAVEDAAFAHVIGTPRAQHLLPPSTSRTRITTAEQPAAEGLPRT
ncbi:hypothetical protein BIU82_10990 [Arthrobacter sp. SW1]|uniref:MFS transporter n=1 Tax=Arthrobacter sp. SW1 TaxID=1920889 RepID=UPI000877E087|nr:MFS transporter [Arthrobacter sp. SW1]OFI36942.1 hypothetical protein BIU82_10990 [Arthrobacter sp. SW1]